MVEKKTRKVGGKALDYLFGTDEPLGKVDTQEVIQKTPRHGKTNNNYY